MTIFTDNKSTKFCQITLCIKRFIHKRKVVPFFLPHGVHQSRSATTELRPEAEVLWPSLDQRKQKVMKKTSESPAASNINIYNRT